MLKYNKKNKILIFKKYFMYLIKQLINIFNNIIIFLYFFNLNN